MIRIKLMGALAHLAESNEVYVEIDKPKTVDEILREVIKDYDKLHDKIIMVNGKVARGDAIVNDGDEIKVMPVLSGG
ncbi:MoaD/ThiS family protein [Thermococcus sp. M39]|uniref:MoaD/ThiS family protein n=1 Tax=unclassified Thermococcus TaxID=2627626 RepID=UPI0014390045|nr:MULTISPECIES: MoaD/ThiS family protein [unclassified Thermococcus]NJE07689.1 MoaD/ThiS family protein [Thermococcus sp. M39]NJE12245.1 MoaD/ThiS family protein [Thermococcus sp. LS2]